MMKEGGKATLVIPPEMAYGDAGSGGAVPPGATLKFEVELFKGEVILKHFLSVLITRASFVNFEHGLSLSSLSWTVNP